MNIGSIIKSRRPAPTSAVMLAGAGGMNEASKTRPIANWVRSSVILMARTADFGCVSQSTPRQDRKNL